MAEKPRLQRRDILKLGGLVALAAPAANVIGRIGDYELVESKEDFGGFTIRRHSHDNPPYKLDESIYKRHDVRRSLDALKMNIQMDTGLIKLDVGDYTRYDSAFHNASWLLAMGLGTNGTQTDTGLFSWHQIPNADGPGMAAFHELSRWDPADDGLKTEDVTAIVKKAAKFYGASLVGIAPMDERWFFSKVYNVDLADLLDDAASYAIEAGIEVPKAGKVSGRDIIQDAMLAMDKNDMKDMIIQVSTNADPAIMPEGVTVGALRAMPAGMFQKMLPNVIRTFSPEFLVALAEGIPAELLPVDFDPKSILDEEFEIVEIYESIPSATIDFHDGDDNYLNGELGVDGSQYLVSRKMKWVIVMAFEMDPDGIDTEHGHVPEAAVAMGYSRMATTAGTLATFIRNLGYQAIPMGNDTSQSVPFAIHAGLGELSRAGWVITPKYGPRVRLAKVATDLPLVTDEPITFGVTEFCEICGKCAENCPSGAISTGERSYDAPHTGNPGVLKWAANGAKCQQYWSDMGTSCSMCITACPFTKPEGWLHDATRILIGAKSGTVDKILLKLDSVSGYGKGKPSKEFWARDEYMHIK
jgi:reductive dehalogenase